MRRLIIGVSVVAATLAGCTGGPAGSTATGTPPSAAAPTTVSRYQSLAELSAAVSRRVLADRTARVTITSESTGATKIDIKGGGVVRQEGSAVSAQLEVMIDAGGQSLALGIIALPTGTFLKLPVSLGVTSEAKPWFAVDPAGGDPVSAPFAGIAMQIQDSADPAKQLARFGDAVTITGAEPDSLDGTDVVRYSLLVDVEKAATAVTDPALRQQLQQAVAAGVKQNEVTLWLDGMDRARRAQTVTSFPSGGVLTLTVNITDFGVPVDIVAPPPAEVANA